MSQKLSFEVPQRGRSKVSVNSRKQTNSKSRSRSRRRASRSRSRGAVPRSLNVPIRDVITCAVKRAADVLRPFNLAPPRWVDGVRQPLDLLPFTCVQPSVLEDMMLKADDQIISESPRSLETRRVQQLPLVEMLLKTQRMAISSVMREAGLTYVLLPDISLGTVVVTSSAGGVINNVSDINFANATDYASIANVFDEYRIRRARFEYCPRSRYNGPIITAVQANTANCIFCVDYDDATALTSMDQGAVFDTAKLRPLNDYTYLHYKGMQTPDLTWVTTAVPVSNGSFKLYSNDGLSNSTTYGRLWTRLSIEFRQID